MTSNDRLLVKTFPELSDFYNKFIKSEPDPERYVQSKRVWDLLKCRNLDDFCCLYKILDSLNLVVIFEKRTEFLQDLHNLSVKNYMSLSVYSAACASLECRSIIKLIPNLEAMEAV